MTPMFFPVFFGGVGTSLADSIFREGERRSKESNRRWLRSLRSQFVEKFDALGFNIVAIDTVITVGVRVFAASRKYPNMYTEFEVSEERVDNSVKWEYYLNRNRRITFSTSLVHLMSMLGVKYSEGKNGGFQFMDIEWFEGMTEKLARQIGVEPTPYRFVYEDADDGVVRMELDRDTDWFKSTHEMLYFTTSEPVAASGESDPMGAVRMGIDEHRLYVDCMQCRLLEMFRKNTVSATA